MNQSLAQNSDRPFAGTAATNKFVMMNQDPVEHPALNWTKLIFLVLLTYGLMVSMWFICLAMFTMKNGSVPQSFESGGGLLFGLFCFYVLSFGIAWRWGSSKRQQMRLQAVEDQIARQKAMDAMMNLE